MKRLKNNHGFSLIESLAGMFLLTLVLIFVLAFESTSFQMTASNRDREFAIQKAMQILNELKAFVGSGMENQAEALDTFDDGVTTYPVLTIDDSVTDPGDPLSGNTRIGDNSWHYRRRITVRKLPNESSNDVRFVTVRIYGREPGDSDGQVLADVSGVIRTVGYYFPPTQTLDVYLLAISNVPGWWVYMSTIQPLLENALSDLEARNPGLEFRTHWITSLSYGRDQEYLPYLNAAQNSEASIDNVYFYPGKMPDASPVSFYYSPERIKGRLNVDGTIQNGYDSDASSPNYNPYPFALADQFNHSMRYHDELALFNRRVAKGLEQEDAPTYRLFLEQMYMEPERFQNVIVINLHGELMPVPPIRNYSDPAKDPLVYPEVRAVTHPQKLRSTNNEDLKLRVYSYLADPSTSFYPNSILDTPISVLVKGVHSTPTITRISGGVDINIDLLPDDYVKDAAPTSASVFPLEMYATASDTAEGTLVRLYNSPLRCPEYTAGGNYEGLPSSQRLYGMDYIPCSVDAAADFLTELDDDIGPIYGPKNTARWIISFADAALPDDGHLIIETRIGTDFTTGTLYPVANDPPNLSRTYAWRGQLPPITERVQHLGDPRHNPYLDVRAAKGYNWWFQSIDATVWPGLSDTDTGWGLANIDLDIDSDIPRIFQTIRDANCFARTVFTTMTGYSFFYVGLGGEIGYDSANGFTGGIPVSMKPYNGTGGTGLAQEILGRDGNTDNWGAKIIAAGDLSWYSKPWLGELYPDTAYSSYWADQGSPSSPRGNVPAGPGSNNYRRVLYSQIPAFGYDRNKRTKEEGCASFFNSTGGSTGPFNHYHRTGTFADVQPAGQEMEEHYNFPIPSTFEAGRPFSMDANANFPPEFNLQPYASERALTTMRQTFYQHQEGDKASSSLIQLTHHTNNYASFYVMNGLSPTGDSGAVWLARYAGVSLVEGFLSAGIPSVDFRIPQLPRVAITEPAETDELDNPSSISVAWSTDWVRWDEEKYTSAYPDGFSETTPLLYRALYSKDGGATWYRMQDDVEVEAGERPVTGLDVGASPYDWSVAATDFPEGNYLIRVEAFRQDIQPHYSYHQKRIFVKR